MRRYNFRIEIDCSVWDRTVCQPTSRRIVHKRNSGGDNISPDTFAWHHVVWKLVDTFHRMFSSMDDSLLDPLPFSMTIKHYPRTLDSRMKPAEDETTDLMPIWVAVLFSFPFSLSLFLSLFDAGRGRAFRFSAERCFLFLPPSCIIQLYNWSESLVVFCRLFIARNNSSFLICVWW